MHRIGVDLGGTKIELVLLDDKGVECYRQRIATPKQYGATLTALAGLIHDAEQAVGQRASVGIGIPGIVSARTGLVKNSNAIWLNGQPMDRDLGAMLGREVRITNDANCFAVSEAVDGAGAGNNLVFGAILGTGCGAGIAINHRVHAGGNGIGGEWGHNPLPWMTAEEFNSTRCFCGNADCIETFVSGTGFVRDFRSLGGQADSGIEIVSLMQTGNALAKLAFGRFIDRLARALAHVVNLLDPDVIVLGGGVSNIELIYEHLPSLLPKYVVGRECDTAVVKNHHGASSGVRGAAWLWAPGEVTAL